MIRVDLTGKTALVTGGAKGIGRAVATALAESGANVVVNYLSSREQAEELVRGLAAHGGKATALNADVASAEDVEGLFQRAEEYLGGAVDILVNNAGTQVKLSTIEGMTLELWERVIAINLTSAMLCCRRAIPGMKRKGWGRIVNISSISGSSGGGPGGAAYASAKGGMSSLSKALAKELGSTGVTSNAVAPGVILTELHEKFSTHENLEQARKSTLVGRLGEPAEVAGAVLFLISDSASYITGETIAVNGGLRLD